MKNQKGISTLNGILILLVVAVGAYLYIADVSRSIVMQEMMEQGY